MKENNYTIKGGLYLVVDPSMPLQTLLTKLESALQGGVDIVQVWNYWQPDTDKINIINTIASLAHSYTVPVIINEEVELFKATDTDGIHFDTIPGNFPALKSSLSKSCIIGITCGNDFDKIEWAIEQQLDYISFCSVFPSSSVNTCDLVSKEVMIKARAATQMPIFLSGGINTHNMEQLSDTGFNGIAVVSGIMAADDTAQASLDFKHAANKING